MKNIFLCVLGLALSLLIGVAQNVPASGTPENVLFEQKCSICHSIERPESKVKTRKENLKANQKEIEEWETTVTRMRNDHDAPITDDEARVIIEYLAKHYGG